MTSDASATVSLGDAGATARPAAGAYLYEGTIAGKAVLFRLDCFIGSCRGTYFYEATGATIRLDETSPNTFEERVGAPNRSKVTGSLAFRGPGGGPTWEGVWTAPGKSEGVPILLKTVARGSPRTIKRSLAEKSAKDPDCKVTITSFAVVGLLDPALEDQLNIIFSPERIAQQLFDPAEASAKNNDGCGMKGERCDDTANGYRIMCRNFDNSRGGLFYTADVKPSVLDTKILSARQEYGFDGGGVHPSDGLIGLTIDLRDGHIVGARDLLADPAHEPKWSSLVPSAFFAKTDKDTAAGIEFGLDDPNRPAQAPVIVTASKPTAWNDFYLVPNGIALIPRVPEVARVFRHQPQVVPFAKLTGRLSPTGSAAHLYAR